MILLPPQKKKKTMLQPPADDEEWTEYTQETREASPAHLLTKINSFSMLLKNGITELESMEFEVGDYKWKVIINLDGGEYISVNLSMVGTTSLPAGWEVNAIFNFLLYNHISDKYLCFRGKARRFHAINSECIFSNLIAKKSLTDPSNGYLSKDTCVFGAEVFVIKKQPLIENVHVLQLSTTYKRKWKILEFSNLKSSWESEEFSVGGYKWFIEIYPNGFESTRGLYVSIFLDCVDAENFGVDKKVSAACLFRLKNKFNEKYDNSYEAINWYTPAFPSWGTEQFIAISDMKDPEKGFVVDDCCNLELQLSILAIHETSHTAVNDSAIK